MPRIPLLATVLLTAAVLAGCRKPEETPAPVTSAATTPTAPAVADVQTPAPPQPAAGSNEMPALSVPTLDGKTYDLAAHRGKWV
ncbi:MAG: hypothetical protein ACYC42_09565, partial [Lysobacter sp.]